MQRAMQDTMQKAMQESCRSDARAGRVGGWAGWWAEELKAGLYGGGRRAGGADPLAPCNRRARGWP